MFTLFRIKIKCIQNNDYLFSFNLYLLPLAHENLCFNTLDLEKVQGKSLGCINSRGTPPLRIIHPCYREPLQRDERAACGSPTPGLELHGRTWSRELGPQSQRLPLVAHYNIMDSNPAARTRSLCSSQCTPLGPHHHTERVSNPGCWRGRRALYQGG